MNTYSTLMFIFGGITFLYGLICFLTKNYKFLPYKKRRLVKRWSIKKHVRKMGIAIMIMSIAPIISGICALLWPFDEYIISLIILIVGFVITIYIGTDYYEKDN